MTIGRYAVHGIAAVSPNLHRVSKGQEHRADRTPARPAREREDAMFETTLIASRRQKGLRQRLLALPAAIAIHGLAVTFFVVGQLWAVAPAPEPVLPVVLHLPSPPPSMPKSAKASTPRQTTAPSRTAHRPPVVQITEVPSETAKPAEPTTGSGKPTGFEGFEEDFDDGRGSGEGGGEGDGPGITEQAVTDDDDPIPPSPDVHMPVAISRVDPHYPELARKTKTHGVVILEAIINRSGQVVDVRILKDIGFGCGEAALLAVRQWQYVPATLNGRKVSVYLTITVNFQLA
ncbi:MAG: energy transducer TonB [Thermoanaerobaculaceae bacterium]|jgi:protein TonB|nr:energy transducer TonB [Thermoanaerobaculaceae bacterium]